MERMMRLKECATIDYNSLFEVEEREYIVLRIKDVDQHWNYGNFEIASVPVLGYIDVETGELIKQNTRLNWTYIHKKFSYKLKVDTAYRVKAKKIKNDMAEKVRKQAICGVGLQLDSFYLTEVIGEEVKCQEFEDMLQEFYSVVTIEDDVFGKLVLDKKMSWFEGSFDIAGVNLSFSINVDIYNKSSWGESLALAKVLLKDKEKLELEARQFAGEELTELANDWSDDLEEEDQITEEMFASRIKIDSIHIDDKGVLCLYYDDDEMFLGHCVCVYYNIKDGFTRAEMAG